MIAFQNFRFKIQTFHLRGKIEIDFREKTRQTLKIEINEEIRQNTEYKQTCDTHWGKNPLFIQKCEFCKNWNFQYVNFWIQCGFLPLATKMDFKRLNLKVI